MDIEIDSPVKLSMNFIDFDEHIPSLKASINLEPLGFKYDLSLSTTLWFECEAFDKFLEALKRKSASTLVDMKRNF